jgi:hypothetical protein
MEVTTQETAVTKVSATTGQEGFKTGKLDSPEYQIGPSSFSKGNNSLWSAAQ